MKKYTHCPYCKEELDQYESSKEYVRYSCRERHPDHTFLQSILGPTNEPYAILSRVSEGDCRYYIRIDLIRNISKIWSGRFNDILESIIIPQVIDIDFDAGQEYIKSKIKCYLAFS